MNSTLKEVAIEILEEEVTDDDSALRFVLSQKLPLEIMSKESGKMVDEMLGRIMNRRREKALKSGDQHSLAISHYNTGQYHRSFKRNKDAIRHYVTAGKTSAIYKEQAYYYSELAGLLFLEEKYHLASNFYRRSLEIERKSEVVKLYADALLYAGEYESSLHAFKEYINATEYPRDEFMLKARFVQTLVRMGFHQQARYTKASMNAAAAKNNKPPDIKDLEKALTLDCLSGLAWFNMAVNHLDIGDLKRASEYYLCSALCVLHDLEAWVLSIIVAIQGDVLTEVHAMSMRAAYALNGEAFVEEFVERLERSKATEEMTVTMKTLLYDLIEDVKNETHNIELRVFDSSDGKFKDVLSDKKQSKTCFLGF